MEQKNNACHARACMRGREGEMREREPCCDFTVLTCFSTESVFQCMELFSYRAREAARVAAEMECGDKPGACACLFLA